jgi:putative flippase GtrA
MLKNHGEAKSYTFFGAFTVLVSIGSYTLFVWIGIAPVISNAVSWILAVMFAFCVNKWLVFESRSTEKGVVVRELGSFIGARILTGIIAILLFPLLLVAGLDGSFMGTEGLLARILTSFVEIVLNYIFSKYLIFGKGRAG